MSDATGSATAPHPAAPAVAAAPAVTPLRRGLTLVSSVVLLFPAQQLWAAAAAPPVTAGGHLVPPTVLHGALIVVAVAAFGVLLAAAVVVGGVSRPRILGRIDVTLLATALVLALGRFALAHIPNDEGALTDRAATALLHGQHVYGVAWPSLFVPRIPPSDTIPLTKTMSGGGDYIYGYPPLGVLLTAAVAGVLHHATVAAPLVAMAALVVTAVVLWMAVPPAWRPLATVVVLGLDGLAVFARGGSPILVAIALLLPVLLRFDTIGDGGRLGPPGLARAAALGAACATQQLVWFLVPLLAVVLYGLRVPEVGHRRAALVVGRFVLTAAAVWLLLDLPFLITQPRAWLGGILLPFRQHAILHGQGFVDIPYLLTGGSGGLDLLSTATAALFAGLLVLTFLFPARLAPAIAVTPVAIFFLATRGSYDYWVQFAPLWLAVAATVPLAAFSPAWRPAVVERVAGGWRSLIVVIALAPAAVLAVAAVTIPPPLHIRITAVRPLAHHGDALGEIDFVATNVSAHPVSPHFAWRSTGSASDWWRVRRGPRILAPGERASYAITAPTTDRETLVPDSVLLAVSDGPMTVSNGRLPATTTLPWP